MRRGFIWTRSAASSGPASTRPTASVEPPTTTSAHGSPYRALFSIPGSKAFCLSGAVARLPISMMGLGIVLALNHIYDNWTIAGAMSAAYILAVASVTPFYARLFDRFGQRRVGAVVLTIQVIAMLVFAFAALLRVPIPLLFVLAVAMGLTQFSFGALVRTRWSYALRGSGHERQLNTAYALESAIDEMVFILGPILAAFLATSVHPVSQLFVPTLACAIGGAVFLSLKDTQPPVIEMIQVAPADRNDADVREALGDGAPGTGLGAIRLRALRTRAPKPKNVLLYRGVLPVLVIFAVFNMSFNAFDLSITAMMKYIGMEPLLGVQLAMFAVGSCIGGLLFGLKPLRGSNWRHLVLFLALLTVGYVLIRLVMDHLMALGVMSLLSGLCVSPIFATGNLIVKGEVPARQLTEGLSWLTTAGQIGASLGSTIAGMLLDRFDFHVGLLMPCVTTLVALVFALVAWAGARRG